MSRPDPVVAASEALPDQPWDKQGAEIVTRADGSVQRVVQASRFDVNVTCGGL